MVPAWKGPVVGCPGVLLSGRHTENGMVGALVQGVQSSTSELSWACSVVHLALQSCSMGGGVTDGTLGEVLPLQDLLLSGWPSGNHFSYRWFPLALARCGAALPVLGRALKEYLGQGLQGQEADTSGPSPWPMMDVQKPLRKLGQIAAAILG